jgi:hypothetical protein
MKGQPAKPRCISDQRNERKRGSADWFKGNDSSAQEVVCGEYGDSRNNRDEGTAEGVFLSIFG